MVVAQRHHDAVARLADEFRAAHFPIRVVTSDRGAALGRNAGVASLPAAVDFLLHFPNDTTTYPPGTLARLRELPESFTAGALTVVDEAGPKFVLPGPGASLDRWNVWSVIEMGLLIRRTVFDRVGGFDPGIGTGAPSPWQAGEVTDLLLRLMDDGLAAGFDWQPANLHVGGITDAHGLASGERRRKLRGYGRGLGRLVTRWRYPLWWRLAFVAGGLLFGVRNRRTHAPLDGWWVFLGRLEGCLGRVLGSAGSFQAVAR